MEGSDEVYDRLMRLLRDRIPELAAQLSEEIAAGRSVEGERLSEGERITREGLMREARVGRLQRGDVAAVPYTADERLMFLCQALLRMAETLHGSLQVVSIMAGNHHVESSTVEFAEPDGTSSVGLDLSDLIPLIARTADEMRRLVMPVEEAVGVRL
ncbi:hypothetical protein [Streptomyces sp. NBRC 110028]|uniref:hypothetical protein n=1 Tax=Streptomyces sp. NBRC 110028 TaxID=1621260 RepID=UPI0006E3C6C5|nr:hypothetical protein [Streptomyces sp. NBRC 110028]